VIFWSFEVLQVVKSKKKNIGTGTNESYPNHVVVKLFFVFVVLVGDGDKAENSLIPLSESVILLNAKVSFFDIVCKLPEYWQTCFNCCLVVSVFLQFN